MCIAGFGQGLGQGFGNKPSLLLGVFTEVAGCLCSSVADSDGTSVSDEATISASASAQTLTSESHASQQPPPPPPRSQQAATVRASVLAAKSWTPAGSSVRIGSRSCGV